MPATDELCDTEAPPLRTSRQLASVGRMLFPHRLAIGLAVAGGAALFAHRTERSVIWPGGIGWFSIAIIAAGFLLRAWASGCAGSHTREDVLCSPAFVTGGPFAFVRNPIYLGTAILGLGVVGLLRDPCLLAPYAVAMALLYGTIIPAEEQHLRSRFGPAYLSYATAVPRLRPRLTPWRGARRATFSWTAGLWEAPLMVIVALLVCGIRFLQHRPG